MRADFPRPLLPICPHTSGHGLVKAMGIFEKAAPRVPAWDSPGKKSLVSSGVVVLASGSAKAWEGDVTLSLHPVRQVRLTQGEGWKGKEPPFTKCLASSRSSARLSYPSSCKILETILGDKRYYPHFIDEDVILGELK